MTISTLVKAALAGDSSVTALVGTRVYPLILPQTPTYPAITYQRISSTGTNGNTALRASRYQVNCWATTHAGAQALAGAVKTLFEEYTSTTSGIKMSLVVNELDDYDDDTDAYRIIVDIMLTTTGD